MSMINDPKNLDRFDQNQLSVYSRGHFLHVKIRPPEYKFLCFILEPSISVCYRNRAFAVYLEGSTFSGGNRLYTRGNMTSQWKQLYLSRAKLKAVSRTSALFAGFAMVAMVEVQLDSSVKYDPTLLIMFSAVTTCLVAVHLFALMISTCMLPNIEAVSNIHHAKAIEQSPHRRMRTYIEVAWILSTGVGLILFMIEIGLLIWLKFTSLKKQEINSDIPAWVATAVLIPVVFFFVAFAVYFYRSLAEHKYTMFKDAVNELEMLGQEVQTGGNFSMLHPGTMEDGYHRSVSRMPSGMSMQSQQENQTTTAHELQVPSQASSLSGHFSVDAC